MGLDTSHNAWHGSYSSFQRWRRWIAQQAGMPPLDFMEGFFYNYRFKDGLPDYTLEALPIKWESLKEDYLHELLVHSDCDGDIPWEDCKGIANRLTEILTEIGALEPYPDEEWIQDGEKLLINRTIQFRDGLMLAFESKENLEFH